MKPVVYTHTSGLVFTTERLVSFDKKSDHDISVICLWLPGAAREPLLLINWYYGEPEFGYTKEFADRWLASQTPQQIVNLLECQED